MKYLLLALFCCSPVIQGAACADSSPTSFRKTIAPLLRDRCLSCHHAKQAEGGYRVDSYDELLKPGDSGEPPVSKAADHTGELLRRIVSEDEFERMPAESEPLAADQIADIKKWIREGATFDGQDSSRPLAIVIPPADHPQAPAEYPQPVPITGLRFSPDGQRLISGGYHELLVWNPDDGQLLRRIGNVGQRVFALAFAADGNTLAVGCGQPGRSGEVRLIDFSTGQVVAVIARAEDVVLDLAFRPGTRQLAVAMADNTIRLVDVETQQVVKTIASHADRVTAVSWSRDGRYLASASRDHTAKVYDANDWHQISSYSGHANRVHGVAILDDHKHLVSVGDDQKIHRWELETAKKVAEITIGGQGFQIHRTPNHLLVPCSDHRVRQIDLSKNAVSGELGGHEDWVLSVAVTAVDSSDVAAMRIASGSFDGEIRIYSGGDNSLVTQWTAVPSR